MRDSRNSNSQHTDDSFNFNRHISQKYPTITISEGDDPLNAHYLPVDYSHNMHKQCLKDWFAQRAECPVCRTEIEVDMFYQPQKMQNRAGYPLVTSVSSDYIDNSRKNINASVSQTMANKS